MHQVTIKPEWIIRQEGGEALPRRLVELLVKVHEAGSLAAACKSTGISYRHAWVISIVTRRQGLMVARGNPKDIYRIGDLVRPDVHFINRQPGSGTRLLLELQLQKEGIDPARIKGHEQCEYTHAAVAAFVASGMADVGYGLETPARQFKLDFIPTQTERYCLVCHEKTLASPALQQVLTILRSTKYKAAVNELPGYKVLKSGVPLDLGEAFGVRQAPSRPARTVRRRSSSSR